MSGSPDSAPTPPSATDPAYEPDPDPTASHANDPDASPNRQKPTTPDSPATNDPYPDNGGGGQLDALVAPDDAPEMASAIAAVTITTLTTPDLRPHLPMCFLPRSDRALIMV